MNPEYLSCFLCKDKSIAQVKMSLKDFLCYGKFPAGRLFSIDRNDQPDDVSVISRSLAKFVERETFGDSRKDARGFGRGSTYWNESEPPFFPEFGDRIGKTIIVCNKCCEGTADLKESLAIRYGTLLSKRYGRLCADMFDYDLHSLDPDKLSDFLKDAADSMACDPWVATLLELYSIEEPEPKSHMGGIQRKFRPLVEAFQKSNTRNGNRLQSIKFEPLPSPKRQKKQPAEV